MLELIMVELCLQVGLPTPSPFSQPAVPLGLPCFVLAKLAMKEPDAIERGYFGSQKAVIQESCLQTGEALAPQLPTLLGLAPLNPLLLLASCQTP